VFLVDVSIERGGVAVCGAAKVAEESRLSGGRRMRDSFVLHQGELAREVLVARVTREPVQHGQLQMLC
jgi:hypothetical protein